MARCPDLRVRGEAVEGETELCQGETRRLTPGAKRGGSDRQAVRRRLSWGHAQGSGCGTEAVRSMVPAGHQRVCPGGTESGQRRGEVVRFSAGATH